MRSAGRPASCAVRGDRIRERGQEFVLGDVLNDTHVAGRYRQDEDHPARAPFLVQAERADQRRRIHGGSRAGQPRPAQDRVGPVEVVAVGDAARYRHMPRGQQAQGREFGHVGAAQLPAAGPQRPQQRAFVQAFVEAGLQGGEQHREAGQQHEQQHVLDRQCHLAEEALHLLDDQVHLQDGERRKTAHQFDQQRLVTRRQVEAGHPGSGESLQYAGREHHVEVGAERIPLHAANAAHLGRERFCTDTEAQFIAQPDAQPLRQLCFHRHQRPADIVLAPPATADDAVVTLQLHGPGEIEFAVQRVVILRLLGHCRAYRLSVDADQATAHHGVELRGWDTPAVEQGARPVDLVG